MSKAERADYDPRRPKVSLGVLSTLRWPAAVVTVALSAAVALGSQPTGAARAQSDVARRLQLHRDAVAVVRLASRRDAPADEGRRATREAAARLEALASELPPELQAELRRASRDLTTASQADPFAPIDPAPLLALLERARARLEGEVALGLTFQGSYSQTKPKEPAYGGHASAMGPAPAPSPDESAASSPVTFEEAARLPARTYGGGPTKDHILESTGSGIALFDYDADGRLDIYLVTAAQLTDARERIAHRNTLYRNLGNWKFEDVSRRAGVDAASWGSGACAGDADADGRLDLYVTNWGPNFLFRNRGDGTFEEIAVRSGLAAGGWSTGCAFFDADADGDLDLYVARYVQTTWEDVVRARRSLVWRNGPKIMVGPAGLPGEADLYFENVGNGRFQESAARRGLVDESRAYGFAVVTTDYDDDGFVDVFVANDSNPNFLYTNVGDGRFESAGLLAGVAVNGEARAQAGMGADAVDFDGDSRIDLVLTAFAHDRNTLYRNLDGHQFEDVTVAAGLAATTFTRMGWGAAFLDADLDGRPDLFFANGHIFSDIDQYPQLGETYRQKNQFLLNTGAGFRDVSAGAGAGIQVARSSRGLAVGDLDNDGDLDVVVSNMDEEPTVLENRQRTGRHWFATRLVGPAGNRFAIGAKVTIEAGGRKQLREIRSGGGYLSQSDLRAYFGLGDAAGPVSVEVRMPGGRRWRWQHLPADRLHVLELTDSASITRTTAAK
jgi:hypothetical protein